MTDELAYCNPKVTCVVEADLETVWKLFKQWGTFYWIKTVSPLPLCLAHDELGCKLSVGNGWLPSSPDSLSKHCR